MEDVKAPIEPTVEDAGEVITSFSRRSTLIGHQLNQHINPLEVPKEDTVGSLESQNHWLISVNIYLVH